MQKTKAAEHYEWIDGMSAEFQELSPDGMTPATASYWQLRLLLAIAQQLSVIVGTLKDRD